MEDFLKINWSWSKIRTSKEQEQFYQCNLSDDERDVFYGHINEIDSVHLLDEINLIQDPNNSTTNDRSTDNPIMDPRTGKKIAKFLILSNKSANNSLFSNFSRNSKLSARQHSATIRVLQNRKMGKKLELTVSEKMDLELYFSIIEKRQQERKLFLDFVREHFFSHTINRCQNVNQALNEYIIAKRACKLEALHENVPRTYNIVTAFLLKNNNRESINQKLSINLENIVERNDKYVCKYVKELSELYMQQSFHGMTKILEKSQPLNNSMITLQQLAINHRVDFAINSSTLCALLDYSMNFNCTWNIPFHIRTTTENHSKTIICCKPLTEQYVSAKQRNALGYKWRIKACLKQKQINENCMASSTAASLTTSSSSSLSSSSIDDQKIIEYKLYECDNYIQLFRNKFIDNNSNTKNQRNDDDKVKNNLNYITTLWNLKSDADDNENLQLLVRTKLTAIDDTSNQNHLFVNFSIKIEYQVEFGAEQMTCSELIREWCRQKFCPESITERIRIDVSTGCILSVRRLTLEDIEFDLDRLYKIKTDHLLANLLAIIKYLQKLPPQENYLLRHTPDNKENANIYTWCQSKESITKNSFDLHKFYEIEHYEPSPIDLIEWIPIDDMEVMPVHRQSSIMPCAFPFDGKKKNNKTHIQNDREKLIKVAEMKRKQFEADIAERNRILESKRKKIKNEIRARKRKQLQKEDESSIDSTLDPYEVFDNDGNINFGTMNMQKDEQLPSTSTSTSTSSAASTSKAYNYNDYIREAFGSSSSSSSLHDDRQQELK